MKAYIVAFLTLAAVATAVAPGKSSKALDKINYVRLIERKLREREVKRRSVSSYFYETCEIRTCSGEGGSCPDSTVCAGYSGCLNGTCIINKPGDYCDYECYGPSLFCDVNRCREYDKLGEVCDDNDDCVNENNDLYCSEDGDLYRDIGICKSKNKKIGDECEYDDNHYCNYNYSYCTATSESRKGICKALPSKLGEECDPNLGITGCNFDMELYCSSETKKCVDLPKDGEECYYAGYELGQYICHSGYYCTLDNKCRKKKNRMEECDYWEDCHEYDYCLYNKVEKKNLCMNRTSGLGGYCNYMEYGSEPECISPYVCENNKCVDLGYECIIDEDCNYYHIYMLFS